MTIPKFRAWNKEDKIMAAEITEINFKSQYVRVGIHAIWHGVNVLQHELWYYDEIELMQCIGKDEEGNEVFEGDILKYNYSDNDIFSIDLDQELESSCGCCSTIHGWSIWQALNSSTVVGNIFEHPELLEKA